ncbi:MAG: hypothetical protein K0S80_1783 [Neobacillus sp.]|nr:hypothetical protein [Neobacillus sp.]
MKIELRLQEGEKQVTKTFENTYISALIFRKYYELEKEFNVLNVEPTIEQMDKVIALMVEAFNHQFTIEEAWAGLSTFTLPEKIFEFVLTVKGVKMNPTDEDLKKESEGTPATPSGDSTEHQESV